MEIGERLHGFTLLKITNVPDAGGVFYEMEHEKSGAKLGWLKTTDENKTFSITFKTVPENSTGVFHILEHSVLQGSERYPMKEPFVELIKSSMNTFLNALTFPDKTMYPVSSRNTKDFYNLIRVYMDAVLHPMIYKNENIFLQEGWHYESDTPDGELQYNGIVLNEMRGANSSVDSLLMNTALEGLFPGNCYRYDSGGDPKEIPSLTYESFLDTHRKFYHPSNAIILLDGDVDMDGTLSILDKEYLNAFDRQEISFPIPLQAPTGKLALEGRYAVEELEANQCFLGFAYAVGDFRTQKLAYAADILTDYLTGSNDAPLCRALFSKGLAGDVSTQLEEDFLQPVLTITVRNMEKDNRDEIERTFDEVLCSVQEEGPDRKELEALLDRLEFRAKERDFNGYPTGLMNQMLILRSWLYGGEPTACLNVSPVFAELREEIGAGKFKNYLDTLLLSNPHRATVCMVPSDSFLQEAEADERARLAAIAQRFTAAEREALFCKQEALKLWQATPATEEERRLLPVLTLSDVGSEPVSIPTEVLPDGTLFHRADCGDIRYFRLYFPLKNLTDEEYSRVSFWTGIVGELGLTDLSRTELEREKRKTFGRFNGAVEIYQKGGRCGELSAWFCLGFSCLASKEDAAWSLIHRILRDTDYTKPAPIGEYLHQQADAIPQILLSSGHRFGSLRATASLSEAARLKDLTDGVSFLKWTNQTAGQFDAEPQAVAASMAEAAHLALNPEGGIISVTGGEPKEYGSIMAGLTGLFPNSEKSPKSNATEDPLSAKSGIPISAPISYAVKAGCLPAEVETVSGAWNVFSNIVSMDYLWNQIRVLGGAYGTGLQIGTDGIYSFYSYRDPSPGNSLSVYDNTADFMKHYSEENHDLTPLIIGTIAGTEPLYTARTLGKAGDICYFRGLTTEDRRLRRRQMLETDNATLVELAELLQKSEVNTATCIAANAEMLKVCGDRVEKIETI